MSEASGQRVPLAQVGDLMAPGAPLPFRVLDGHGRLLLAQGQAITDVRQLQALLERGACVEYGEVEAVRAAAAAAAGVGASKVGSARRLTWFDRWEQQVWTLDAMLRVLGRDIALAEQLVEFADELIARVERHPDAALFKCVRQDDKRFALYALTHAINCATVVLLGARQLQWPDARVRSAVHAALTMNASIIELQGRMAEQKDPPTKQQMEQIRSHPTRSAEMLRASGVTDVEWLLAVEDHHERANGPGYPRGNVEPGEVARLVRAADVFTAKISPRALRAPMVPQQAARQLFQEEGGGPLAAALVKSVGVYPPGDFVLLKNGETAVVVQRTANANAPVVAALLGPTGRPIHGAPRRNTQEAATAITGPVVERSQLPRVLPEMVYGALE